MGLTDNCQMTKNVTVKKGKMSTLSSTVKKAVVISGQTVFLNLTNSPANLGLFALKESF